MGEPFICVSLFVAMRLRWSSLFRLEMYYLRLAAIYQLFLKNCPSLWTNQSAGSESPANQRAREPVSVFTHAQGVLWPSFHHRIHTIKGLGGGFSESSRMKILEKFSALQVR